jgi:hypothetical protein
VVGMIGALGLLVWLGLSLSPGFVLAVFVGVCLFLLILHLQSVHAETDSWQLDGPSVALLTLCGLMVAILAITSGKRASGPSHTAPRLGASSAPTATSEASDGTQCLHELGLPSPGGREVEPDDNRRSSATPIKESFATLRGATGAQNDRDWAAFCVDREASITIRVVNPGSPDVDCDGLEVQLKGPRGGLLAIRWT